MATQSPGDSRLEFSERVWLPMWGIGLLGLALGLTAGILTGVAIRNLVGDEPLISGSNATVFYVTFALAVVLDVFLLFNFTGLALTADESGFRFRYGMFGKSFKWEQISSVKATDYRWITYGGWGIRFSTKGRRAWSQIGAKRGVVIDVTEGKNQRQYFISSKRADELAEVLARGIGADVTPIESDSGDAVESRSVSGSTES